MRALYGVFILPFLAVDCLLNALICDGSFRHTMSGEAWRQRDSRYWGWTRFFIDNLFYQGHCEDAARKEAQWGSIWRAWLTNFD